MTRPVKYKIPFDELGNVYETAPSDVGVSPIWKDNFVFKDTLTYLKHFRLGSSVIFYFKSLNKHRIYPMFVSDFSKLLINKGLNVTIIDNKAVISCAGQFTFRKKGRSYGVYAL